MHFFKKLRPLWFFILTVFLCDSFVTVIGITPPLFSVVVFDYAYPHRDITIFTIFTLAAFAIYFLDFIFSAFIDYINIYIHQKLNYDIALELFQKIEAMPLGLINRMKIGDLSVRLTDDIGIIVRFIVNILSDVVMNIIKLTVFLYITLKFDYRITILALLCVPLYVIETKYFSKKIEDVRQKMQETDSEILEGIQSKLINIRTIKAFNQQRQEAENLGISLRKSFFLNIKESLISIANVFTGSLTIQVWSVFVGWYLGYEVIAGNLTIGKLVALSIYLPLLNGPIKGLANAYKSSRIASVSSQRVMTILNANAEDTSLRSAPLTISGGEILFDNVTFGYQENIPAIENFTLKIPTRGSVALVGDSGSGKSTIINLLLGFYRPQRGTIKIDGQDISNINVDSLREQLGIVFQETAVIPATIRENILYGLKDKSEKDIIHAASAANAHDFIKTMPGGYNSVILPQGRNLSGGQQQRIAIARILLRNPKIFIFDEPTSALDSESEFFIQEAIHRLIGSKTVLIVAHRLSTIKKIEQIVVMSRGNIAEQGSFQELMEKKGEFFKLYNLQFGGFQKFIEMFNAEFQRVIRYKQNLSLVMIKILEFDNISKKFHPSVASDYMKEVDLFIKKHIRIMDFSAVYLEDKIVMALPESDSLAAENMLKRLTPLMKHFLFITDGEKIGASLQAGVVSCGETHAQSGEDLFEMAHKVLAGLPTGTNVGTL